MGKRKALEKFARDETESEESEIESVSSIQSEEDYSSDVTSEDEGISQKKVADEASKRLKMAKEYLAKLGDTSSSKLDKGVPGGGGEDEDGDEIDAAACDREILASRIKHDALQAKAKRFERIASAFKLEPSAYTLQTLRGHTQTPTCVAVTRDGKWAFSGSKTGDIIKWDVETGEKIYRFSPGIRSRAIKKTGLVLPKEARPPGHLNHVISIAVSFDGKYVASGSLDNTINIWDGQEHKHVTKFTQHRGAVTGLAFQYGTYQLYSCSADRTIKIFGLEQLAYIDTLFGHQDAIPAITSLAAERILSVGSRDRTARLWKVPEETQLIFRSSEDAGGSVDTIAMLNEDHFVTGSDEGALSIWSINKKKPFSSIHNAHENPYVEAAGVHAISAMAAAPFSDFLASGSDDGFIRFWKSSEEFKELLPLGSIPVTGNVNGLAFSDNGKVLVAAVGRDHRLGRWSVNKEAKNSVVIIRFA